MQLEVTTKIKNLALRGQHEPVVVVSFTITPRGSANRRYVEALARSLETNQHLGKHIDRIVKGATRLDLHVRPGLAAAVDWLRAVEEAKAEIAAAKADADQLRLPLAMPA